MNEYIMGNFSNIKLPSNRKFGLFFTFVFAVVASYFYYSANVGWAHVFIGAASIFLLVTLIKSDALLPLNKLWMRFGLLLGMIVSPIILGIIFFGLFTPIAILMRLSGRDELLLKFSHKVSHWITRSEPIKSESFKQQF
ncbi:SxtJ family membrane protein [Alphaproteobacteria bacterium]|nr:SxtJ family membrane protein [Alphaproteobacteria bacterium]